MTKNNRWRKQWMVHSRSGGDPHKVSLDRNNAYWCDCWPFKKNRTCYHIDVAKGGGGDEIGVHQPPEPKIVYANVCEVQKEEDEETLLVPLLPLGDEHFLGTLLYDMLRFGVRWPSLMKAYKLNQASITPAEVRAYIETAGRKIYGPWDDELKRHDGFTITREGIDSSPMP